jgi:integrase
VTTVTVDQLARDAQEFLRFKRAMGIAYWRGEFVLNGFLRYVAQHWGDHDEVALDEAITRWCARIAGRKAVTVANEFGVVRQLCLYRRRRDPSSYVPEHALAPVKESIFLPYIFSHDEVRRVLAAAASHHGRFIWGSMLHALILVLYCTGLRLGEAVRLRTADVALDRGTLMIQRSKGRSRIAAIRADLVGELRRYAAARQRLVRERQRTDPETFFLRLGWLAADHRLRVGVDPKPSAQPRHQASWRARGRAPLRVPPRLCRASTYGLGQRGCRYPRQASHVVGVSRPPEPHRH